MKDGLLPISKVEIEAYLNDAHVYYEITDPMPGDNVPIRLNNKGFFAWFEPICKLYMLPKYNELDLTPFFAPFFMIFFGLCLGDSGYGLFLFLGATAYRLLAKKVTPSMKSIHFADTGTGCFNFLLRVADRYILRSEYL